MLGVSQWGAVFKIHTKDGRTVIVDPKKDHGAQELLKQFESQFYQNKVTGISLLRECGGQTRCPICKRSNLVCNNCGNSFSNYKCSTGVQYSISRPKDCRRIQFAPTVVKPDQDTGNKGGERVTVFVDGFKIDLMAHNNQPALRVTVAKTGALRYNPINKG